MLNTSKDLFITVLKNYSPGVLVELEELDNIRKKYPNKFDDNHSVIKMLFKILIKENKSKYVR